MGRFEFTDKMKFCRIDIEDSDLDFNSQPSEFIIETSAETTSSTNGIDDLKDVFDDFDISEAISDPPKE